jgi:hypothetical protein
MCKYSKTIALENPDSFHQMKLAVSECESMEECDKKLMEWIKLYPELMEKENNQQIVKWSLK